MDFFTLYNIAITYVLNYWWLWVPPVLFFGFVTIWQLYIISKTVAEINWILLEVKIPPGIEKSPKVTEHIFAGLHGALKPISWKRRFFFGEVTSWFSFEIVSIGGEIHFYVRTPESLRNLVESQIFAQYPDSEITEVDDYVQQLPPLLPDDEHDIWGAEFKLVKEDVYPIKTYSEFEEAGGLGEAKRIDPLASFAEVLNKLHSGEQLWLHILVQPTGPEIKDRWTEAGKKLIDKLSGKEMAENSGGFGVGLAKWIDAALPGGAGSKKEDKAKQPKVILSSLEKYMSEAVNRKINKLGFRGGIRFFYVGRKEIFHMSHVAGMFGSFKQFTSQNLNSFVPGMVTAAPGFLSKLFPSEKGFFARQQEYNRKAQFYSWVKNRSFSQKVKPFILNTEELATLYHLPGLAVRAPFLPRIESKKGQAPSSLPRN